MKNKKGFTLIELLAVIVVLAIIALIATPIVMNTIKRSKKGAAERSADSYVKQVETAIMELKLENNSMPDGVYIIDENGNLTGLVIKDSYKCNLYINNPGKTYEEYEKYLDYEQYCHYENKTFSINMNGTKPTFGKIVIENGTVDSKSSELKIGDYTVSYNTEKNTYEATEKGSSLCTANKTKAPASIYTHIEFPPGSRDDIFQEVGLVASEAGAYTPGVSYTCELGDGELKTFFVLEENGDNVSLIIGKDIDSNGKETTTDGSAWISKEDYIAAGGEDLSNDEPACQYGGECVTNEYGPITLQNYLKNSTTSWTKLTESQISLPSASQIATAAGKTFDSSSTSNISLPTWLGGNLQPTGYWTSTPSMSSSSHIFSVDSLAGSFTNEIILKYDNVYYQSGVRPVITVSKSQLG